MAATNEERQDERLDRLENGQIDHDRTMRKTAQTVEQVLLPSSVDMAEEVKALRSDLDKAKGGIAMLVKVGAAIATVLTLALGYMAVKHP